MEIKYKIKTASKEHIFSHLKECNDCFIPPLNSRIELQDYSNKIFEKSVTFEAWNNHDLIGLVSTYFNDNKTKNGYITNVSTTKDFMGKGIASELLKNCIEYAKMHKYSKIYLEVSNINALAIKLYLKIGFRTDKIVGDSVFMKYEMEIK